MTRRVAVTPPTSRPPTRDDRAPRAPARRPPRATLLAPTLLWDEPDIALDSQGNFIVAWSDRFGYDGHMMGVFARIYDDTGAPLTGEFQVNVEWAQSQWEPLVSTTPDDHFVVAWSGRSNGDAFFRVFDGDGTPLTGDVQVNTFVNNAQIDTALAIAPDGTLFATYVDFGANGFGGGQNIFGRRFTTGGAALDPVEFQLHENYVAGDQREPRIVVDRRSRFLVAWEDSAADGSGYGIVARRFDSDGTPLGAEFIVNTTTTGDQRNVALAMDWVGNFIVAWTDASTVPGRLVARRYDQHGAPLGGEFEVRNSVLGDIKLPDVAVDEAGEEFVFAFTARYEGPPGPSTPQTEIYAKRYAFEPIHLPAPATVGTTFDLDLHFPGGAGYYYFLLGAFSTTPGIPLPDGRVVPLAEDVMFNFSLAFPNGGVLNGFQGWLDAAGQATAMVTLPNDPGIVGVTLHFAAVTVDVTQFDLINQLRHVTDAKAVVLR